MSNKILLRVTKEGEGMDRTVYGQLFGNPQILLNGEPILFPFSKINALLYYLIVNKTVSRDEVAGLLWPDMNEKNAKKNLRNTIYQANKLLGEDYICSPNKGLLMLNETLPISSDVELFKEQPLENLSLYQDHFLKGFFLKDSEEFDLWTIKMRNFFEKKFVNECYRKVTQDIEMQQYNEVQKNLQHLISIDEYDERNYQLLMNYYQAIERHEKVIEVYYQLADILNTELGIGPSQETRAIFENSVTIVKKDAQVVGNRFKTRFFGRLEEIKQLETNFNCFYNGEKCYSILVKGEAGSGKTSLVNRVLDNIHARFHVLETQCYEVEISYDLRPWRKIFSQISHLFDEFHLSEPAYWQATIHRFFPTMDEFIDGDPTFEAEKYIDLNILSQVLIEAIRKISESKKLVIVIEDVQWLDEMSFRLLTSALLHLKNNEAMFVFTLRDETNVKVDNFSTTVNAYDLLTEIKVFPLTFDETKLFCDYQLANQKVSEAMILELYTLTEGNFFFLIEYINMIRNNSKIDIMNLRMQDALRNRFIHLSAEETKIVEVVSFFYDYVSVQLLAEIMNIPAFDLAQSIERLVNSGILVENMISDEVGLTFSHSRLREFVYMNQMTSKKRLLHKEIAHLLEKSRIKNQNDHLIVAKIAHHYEEAREWLKSLDFQLRYLQSYFKFYHELFPVNALPNEISAINKVHWKKGTTAEFDKIRTKLADLKEEYQEEHTYKLLVMRFYNIEGRFLIKQGKYEQGVKDIQSVIAMAKEMNESYFLLEGYKQMINYYIQIDASKEMYDYIELALNEAIRSNNHESIGILLRLKGVNYLMTGNLSGAEKQFNESINTFMITDAIKEKYSINIAAAYDYLAEIRSIEGKYDDAVILQQKAIDLCENKGAYSSLSVFYINMGIILFAKNEYQQAKDVFKEAYKIYEEFSSLWKRPQLDAYMSLINLYQENYQAVFVYLISSKKYMERFSNPRDMGTFCFAAAMIKRQLVQKNHRDNKLWEMLDQEEHFYYRKALEYLSPNRNKLETNLLKRTFKEEESVGG